MYTVPVACGPLRPAYPMAGLISCFRRVGQRVKGMFGVDVNHRFLNRCFRHQGVDPDATASNESLPNGKFFLDHEVQNLLDQNSNGLERLVCPWRSPPCPVSAKSIVAHR